MKFNLSANIATYDGAWAGSAQVGALVSPHAAFNAGISGAFNHHGKVGARMGMTFGW